MQLIDTHCHLYEPEFDADREQTILRAREAGVVRLLLPAIDSASDERMLRMVADHPELCRPMIGLHPTSVNDNPGWRDELARVETALRQAPAGRFCGVGEIGLDFHWSNDFRDEQIEALRRQLELSIACDLPVAIHTRDAWPQMREVIASYRGRGLRGVFHAFADTVETYRELKASGDFLFGIGGVATYRKSLLAVALPEMELSDLVLETDCPYLPPVPHRGERNEPAYLRFVCARVAELTGRSPEQVASATTANAVRMFALGALNPTKETKQSI